MTNSNAFVSTLWLLTIVTTSTALQTHSKHSETLDIKQLVKRNLENIKTPSVINIILDPQVDSSTSESILHSYQSFRPLITTESRTKNTCMNVLNCYKMHNIVGIFNTTQDVRWYEWQSLYGNSWDTLGLTVLWISHCNDLQEVETLLDGFWQERSLNVVVILLDTSLKGVYTYNPFILQAGGKRGSLFQVLGDTLFPDKTKNLHEYPIPISFYTHRPHSWLNDCLELVDGVDIKYSRFLSKWMNFSIALKTARLDYSSYTVTLPDGTKTSAVGDLVTGRSDFLGNSAQLYSSIPLGLDTVYPHWRSRVLVLVPREPPVPGIFLLFQRANHFNVLIIALLIGVLVICLVVKDSSNVLLETLSLLLFQMFPKIRRWNSERILCISWIFWSFVMNSLLQGNLVHQLSAPPFYRDIDTLWDLARSNLSLMVKNWEQDILTKSRVGSVGQRLLQKSIVNMNSSDCLMELHQYRNVACAIDGNYAVYTVGEVQRALLKHSRGNEDALDVHIMKEPLLHFWRTYIVKKGFPLLPKMDFVTTSFIEFGIMKKWVFDDLSKTFKMKIMDDDVEAMKLVNFKRVFALFFFGNFIATLVFIAEILIKKFQLDLRIWKKCSVHCKKNKINTLVDNF